MKRPTLFFGFAALALIPFGSASAQTAVLAEMYGRGVHAYNAGLYQEASEYLGMAIDNGIQDPRAYYFRGIVAFTEGKTEEAEADWQLGAEMEAAGRTNASVGRSISRFQGIGRIRLEEIRQQARLDALAAAAARSKQRYGELGVAPPGAVPSAGTANARPAITPPPIPPDTENPFLDDLATGQPNVAANDALEGAMTDPFAGQATPAAPAAGAGADPFGGNAGGADPFGGGGGGAAGGADPFGGGAGGNDPFGGGGGADPFGGGAAGGADPFGGAGDDPFGSN